jgi:phosphatidylethanolamine/phosphatidyl-N-methylethanolamine N-methyltransferase
VFWQKFLKFQVFRHLLVGVGDVQVLYRSNRPPAGPRIFYPEKPRSGHTLTMSALLFHLLKKPSLTGAVAPSSRYLASAMVRATGEVKHVVELGAGTGPVTKELRSQLPNASLIAVEMQPSLAQQLRNRFPGLDVRQNLAHEVLDSLDYTDPVAVVSSLPFRSLPKDMREVTVASIEHLLRRVPGSRLVQFTYQPRAPFEASSDFCWHKTCSVWRNAPPAGVWVLQITPTTKVAVDAGRRREWVEND